MLTGLQLLWFQWQLVMNVTKLMDLSVDPCVDFYEFACGNYKNVAKIPDDRSSMQRFTETDEQIQRELRGLFEEPEKPDDLQSTRMVRQFYRSCVNEQQLEKLGLEPLKVLLEKYGGWPVVKGDAWRENDYDWMKINARISSTLEGGDILSFSISPNYKNSTRKTLFVDQASLGLGKREFYLEKSNKKILDAYFEYMVATAIQLGAPAATARKELQEALELEIALANITVRDEDRRDVNALYRPMKIAELKSKYPKVDFDSWLKTANEYNWLVKDSDEINLSGQPYLEELPDILSKYSTRTLANFQIWSMGMGYVSSLAPSLRENYRKFKQALSGATKFKPRWQECVEVTSSYLKFPVGQMYVMKYFSEDVKAELDSMVQSIRKAMTSTIDSITWMDTATKANAHKKLSKMIQNIAFPSPDVYNETWVMRDHTKAQLSEDTYLDNKVSLSMSANDRAIREFHDPENRTEWEGEIAEVNAWYSPEKNKMTFPAGILRPSWYYPNAPDYYNYGHIGAVMGHELTHGFDDQGRQYDGDGNFDLWWSNETLSEFTKGAKCFIDQYGNVNDSTTGQNLNGENTQGENIADNGGLKLAYKALQLGRQDEASKSSERNKILPRMANYSTDQLYFLSFGQVWCTLIRPEALHVQIVSDPHSPAKYRVNEPLKNNAHFATAFKCPAGSPMNPNKKCEIW